MQIINELGFWYSIASAELSETEMITKIIFGVTV